MKRKYKFTWLCLGDKKHKKCLNSEIKVIKTSKPLWASSLNADMIESLSIYCKIEKTFILRVVTKCDFFANIELIDYLKNKRLCEFNHA